MKDFLDEFLNAYWLRPESALWRTVDVLAMENSVISGRSLDFACGDGVFSFLRAGGTFAKSFDVFKGTAGLNDFFKNEDVYNHSITDHIKIKDSAIYKISVGFDYKQALLDKAKKLEFYEEIVVGDGNKKLPFKDDEFDSIFSNIVYWLDNISSVLSELYRIVKPGGNVYLMLPDINLLNSSFYYNFQVKDKVQGYEFLSYLDRGRVASNFIQVKTEDDWYSTIGNSGFEVCNHKRHLSSRLLSIWDIGLRPLFPALNNACNRMTEEDRLKFKDDLIEMYSYVAKPLLDLEIQDIDCNKGFHYFHLSK